SSPGQKDDLASQVSAMQRCCLARGLAVHEWVQQIGGGMNLRREKFLAIMGDIDQGQLGTLVIAHKDRLARFGFEHLEHVAASNGCAIVIANQESVIANQESLSPQRERVEDLLAIVPTFSRRLDGLRRYDKTLRDELTGGTR